jgi:sugar phosphate isomerase/epimerase
MTDLFRIGATSFVHPSGWADNVARLAGRVRDVELLFFEADSLPDPEEVEALAGWKARAGLTYSLHTPLTPGLASADEERRRAGVEAVLRALDVARPLAPEAVVVHVDFSDREDDAPPRDLAAFHRRAARSLEALLLTGVPPRSICVETLDYDFELIAPVVEALGLSVALDLGHEQRAGRSVEALLDRHVSRARLVHWHGVDPAGRDHRSLRHVPVAAAKRVIASLRAARYDGALTLEVFGEDDLEESLALLAAWLGEG